jgi:hypothetical protein
MDIYTTHKPGSNTLGEILSFCIKGRLQHWNLPSELMRNGPYYLLNALDKRWAKGVWKVGREGRAPVRVASNV